MVYLISGATHSGKTVLAKKLVELTGGFCLSLDHLKMGLIRSKMTTLKVKDDKELTSFMWPIVKEMIKTAIENDQDLIIEGCYIPFDFKKSFTKKYKDNIRELILLMDLNYVGKHYDDIINFANVAENRKKDDVTLEVLIDDNNYYYQNAIRHHLNYYIFGDEFDLDDMASKLLKK